MPEVGGHVESIVGWKPSSRSVCCTHQGSARSQLGRSLAGPDRLSTVGYGALSRSRILGTTQSPGRPERSHKRTRALANAQAFDDGARHALSPDRLSGHIPAVETEG